MRDQDRIDRLREQIYKITWLDQLEFALALRSGKRAIRRARRAPKVRPPESYLKLDSKRGIAPTWTVG